MARKAPGLVAILGPDSFLAEEALEALLEGRLGPDRQDALELLRGDETSWGRVVDAARSRSLFAQSRVVVVRNAEALKGSEDELKRYVADPNPGATLVLVAAKPDRRRAAWKIVLESAQTVAAEPLKGARLRARVDEELRRRRLFLDAAAADALIERVGQDLRRLIGELDKLEAFAQGRERLTTDEVAAVLGRGFARPFWQLGDAVAERRAGEALELALGLVEDGEEAPLLIGSVYQSLRRLRALRALGDARAPREAKLELLPKNLAFKLNDLERAARSWSDESLSAAQEALQKADRRVKTGGNGAVALAAALAAAFGSATDARNERRAR